MMQVTANCFDENCVDARGDGPVSKPKLIRKTYSHMHSKR
jgi:hypothetical protein